MPYVPGGPRPICPPKWHFDYDLQKCVPPDYEPPPPPSKKIIRPRPRVTYYPEPTEPIPPVEDVPPVEETDPGLSEPNLQNIPNRQPPTERTLTTSALDAAIAITYGEGPIGGTICHEPVLMNSGEELVMAYALGEGGPGGIEAVTKILIDGRDIGSKIVNGVSGLGLVEGVNYNVHLGTKSQTVDPLLAAADPSHVTGWPGLAYVVIHFPQQTVSTGLYDPTRAVFYVKGIKCIDSRVDLTTRAYTDNPVLHEFDLMTNPTYGLGNEYRNMDAAEGSSTSPWAIAATACESLLSRTGSPPAAPTLGATNVYSPGIEPGYYTWTISFTGPSGRESVESAETAPVTMNGPNEHEQVLTWATPPGDNVAVKVYRNKNGPTTKPHFLVATLAGNATGYTDRIREADLGAASIQIGKRYVMSLAMRDALPAQEWIDTIRYHFMGHLAYNAGKWQLYIDGPKSPSGIVFTDQGPTANIVGTPSVRSKGLSQLPSKYVIAYRDMALDFQQGTAEAELPGVATRAEELRPARLNLDGCPTFDQAQRLAITNMNRSAADKEINWDALPEAVQAMPGDVVDFTSALGLTNVLLIVTDAQLDSVGLVVHLRGEFYDEDIYSDTAVVNPIAVGPPTIPPVAPSPPTGLALTEVIAVDGTSKASSKIKVTWDPPGDAGITATRISYYNASDATVIVLGDFRSSPVYIDAPTLGVLYTVQARAVASGAAAGLLSDPTSQTITPIGSTSTGITGAQAFTASNGDNADVALSNGTLVLVVSGPTAPFAMLGFIGGVSGRTLKVFNTTAYDMTFPYESATEGTPGRRIRSLTGADVVLGAKSVGELIYDTVSSRWILQSGHDVLGSYTMRGLNTKTFTATGHFTPPAGVTTVYLTGCAAGGGGGGCHSTPGTGGGGGGGDAIFRKDVTVTPGTEYDVTIGTGGGGGFGGGSNGFGGGSTSFGALFSLTGGGGGAGGTSGVGGVGGTAGGALAQAGTAGGTTAVGMGGVSALFPVSRIFIAALAGVRGQGGNGSTNSGLAAGAGGDGYLIVEW